MNRPPIAILVMATSFVFAACSAAGGPPSASAGGPPVPAEATLDGHTYLSTDLRGAALVPGTRIRLAFADGGLTANGGCNTMSADYSIAGARLRTGQPMATTEMGCDQPLMQQDTWLAGFLGDVAFELDGDTLTLTDGGVRLTLVDKEVATPDQPIEGTRWILEGIVSGDAVSSVPNGVTASLRIAAGRVDLKPGCNTGGGAVTVAEAALTFGPIALTRMACDQDRMAVESAVLTVLSDAVGYTIDADVLTLDAGDAGLIFRAAP